MKRLSYMSMTFNTVNATVLSCLWMFVLYTCVYAKCVCCVYKNTCVLYICLVSIYVLWVPDVVWIYQCVCYRCCLNVFMSCVLCMTVYIMDLSVCSLHVYIYMFMCSLYLHVACVYICCVWLSVLSTFISSDVFNVLFYASVHHWTGTLPSSSHMVTSYTSQGWLIFQTGLFVQKQLQFILSIQKSRVQWLTTFRVHHTTRHTANTVKSRGMN